MRLLTLLSSSATAVLCASLMAAAPPPSPSTPVAPARIDVSKLGPHVGERVPDFTLQDQDGRRRTLRSIMGPKGAMLVFVRSADW